MPGVAQVWFTANELHAIVKASTNTGTKLSPRMEGALLPKLEEARNLLGCPVPFAKPVPTMHEWIRDAAIPELESRQDEDDGA